ncbi:hypothetical protein [Paenibacillus pseudetheri]|uniref:Uncharacterized protein n=1 Tax=Paenibacillus pseudetheri TaxID=2897682 RepID=A0ABM9B910_9BACL|nr:hypothetical protein PAECIP111894_01166 [Paenibacillus pseudetheri]
MNKLSPVYLILQGEIIYVLMKIICTIEIYFTKIVSIIVIMLIPITILYFYSNKTTTDVLRTELNTSNSNQLSFFQNQVESNMELKHSRYQ